MAGARALAPVARSVRTTVSARRSLRCGAVMAPAEPPKAPDALDDVTLSGLNGKPLLVTEWPSKVRQGPLSLVMIGSERGISSNLLCHDGRAR